MTELTHDSDAWRELVDLPTLTAWMDARGLGSGVITDAAPLTGGTQNILLAFTRTGCRYVLRRGPRKPRPESDKVLQREMLVLAALNGTPIPHAGFIAGENDPSVMGTVFYLMEQVNGFNATQGLPAFHASDPAIRRRMGEALVDGIVALSKIDPQERGLSGLGKLDGWLERQVGRWRSQLDGYQQFEGWTGYGGLPDVDKICGWLEANRPTTMKPGLMHGDYHLSNVLYHPDSPELAAIVDWELATLGDPLLDLGICVSSWPEPGDDTPPAVKPFDGFPSRKEMIARYLDAAGRTEKEALWFGVLAQFKLGAILEGSHARACAGLTPKPIGDRLHNTTVRLFQRALRHTGQA